jgi:tetratricopeptide (TPR) repeat protein
VKKFILAFAYLGLVLAALPPLAFAEPNVARDCMEGDTPEIRIKNCTAFLKLDLPPGLAHFAYSARAVAYGEQGKFLEAHKDMEKAVKAAPKDAAYRLNYAVVLVDALDKGVKVQATYQDVITSVDKGFAIPRANGGEMNPFGIVVGCGAKGRAYMGLKKYNEAIAEFTKALEATAKEGEHMRPSLYERRAEAYDAVGETAKADADRAKAKSGK